MRLWDGYYNFYAAWPFIIIEDKLVLKHFLYERAKAPVRGAFRLDICGFIADR